MAGPTDLNDLALALLAGAAAAIDEILLGSSGLEGAPDRQLVTAGDPVDDCCEQLAVHINPVQEAPTDLSKGPGQTGKRHTRAWLNQVSFTVTVGRCVPTVEVVGNKPVLPTVAAILASAAQINADGWALWNGLHNQVQAGDIFGGCTNVIFDSLVARTVSGGCGGWTLTIRAYVGGYRPTGT